MNLEHLKKEIPYRWKIQSFSKDKTKASCVAYINARDVMALLDEVCSPQNWQDEYYKVKDTMFCKIGIKTGEIWAWKSDGGAESDSNFISHDAKIKGEPSDAFKRAAVKWGIGRFLYFKKIKWIKVNQHKKPIDDQDKIIYDLTNHFEGNSAQKPKYNYQPRTTQHVKKIDPEVENRFINVTMTFDGKDKEVSIYPTYKEIGTYQGSTVYQGFTKKKKEICYYDADGINRTVFHNNVKKHEQ